MLARVQTAAVVGLSAVPVTVEVDVSDGLPGLAIVGLPDATVRESKERIRSAVRNSRFAWPLERITVNLAPADVRKEGAGFDLPIALGILAASGQLDPTSFGGVLALGELALDGSLRPIPGALAVALALKGAGRRLLLPAANGPEGAVVEGVAVLPLEHLCQAVGFLRGTEPVEPLRIRREELVQPAAADGLDFSEVKGQPAAKRAVEVAVGGGHHLLLFGPPGVGKSMLAQRIPTIMPAMSLEESLQATLVHSVAGQLPPGHGLLRRRPFRAPHHTISDAGLVGGGTVPRPGELSLAHHGVLFLDEMPEFNRSALEGLRQPLEEGMVTVARVHGAEAFPARVMLVGAMNPCPCGLAGHAGRGCRCSPAQIQRYRNRISGPLLDRMDIHLEVPAVPLQELTGEAASEPSAAIRVRVERSRAVQRERFREEPSVFCNAQMRHRHLRRFCRLTAEGKELIRRAIPAMGLSARGYDRILRVSRTVADLAGSAEIQPGHLAEAIQYRALDRASWAQP